MTSFVRLVDVVAVGNEDSALLTLHTVLQVTSKVSSSTHMRGKNLLSLHTQTESLNRLGEGEVGGTFVSIG